MPVRSKLERVMRDPASLPRAALRRAWPTHPRYGFAWIHLPDGSVTFQERGFVQSESPAVLLARHNFETARIRSLLNRQEFGASLEVGCGFGRLSPVFAEFSGHHVAVDINEDALTTARETYPSLHFQHGSAVDLPFDDDSFDLVVTWTVLQHVPPDRLAKAASEVMRVLRPSGALLTCEGTRRPNTEGPNPHSWHRSVSTYAELFKPYVLQHEGELGDIDRLSGLESPGNVMLWRDPTR